MKVLVFSSLYPNNVWPNHGVFVQERVTRFACLASTRVTVVAPVPYFPPIRWNWRYSFARIVEKQRIEGLDVYHPRYLMIPKIAMALQGMMMFLSLLAPLKSLRRDFDFDLIDGHYIYPDGYAAMLLGRRFGKPVVVTARGSDVNQFKDFPTVRPLLRSALRGSSKVIAVSESLKRSITGLGVPADKVTTIPNGVDCTKFRPIPRTEARARLGLPAGKIILSVGNLTANKGCDLLVQAVKRLVTREREKDLYLVIVGDGPFRSVLARLIHELNLEEHARLIGSVAHGELGSWYSAADVFCLASGREGSPNVVLESLACGTPIVATPVGNIPDIVASDHVGLLTPRDVESLADTIARALVSPWNREALTKVASGRSWDKVALSMKQVFGSALGSPIQEPKAPLVNESPIK